MRQCAWIVHDNRPYPGGTSIRNPSSRSGDIRRSSDWAIFFNQDVNDILWFVITKTLSSLDCTCVYYVTITSFLVDNFVPCIIDLFSFNNLYLRIDTFLSAIIHYFFCFRNSANKWAVKVHAIEDHVEIVDRGAPLGLNGSYSRSSQYYWSSRPKRSSRSAWGSARQSNLNKPKQAQNTPTIPKHPQQSSLRIRIFLGIVLFVKEFFVLLCYSLAQLAYYQVRLTIASGSRDFERWIIREAVTFSKVKRQTY